MVCAFCAQGIEKRLSRLPASQAVFVDLKRKVVVVEAKEGQTLDEKAISAEIADSGYDVVKLETISQSVAEFKAGAEGQEVSSDGVAGSRAGFWSSWAALLASSGTLVCCALPALLVAVGAGAALSSLVSVFPQVVWLSEHKERLFVVAALMLVAAGILQWRNRSAPCPTDPALRAACLKTRGVSRRVYLFSVLVFCLGGLFAFVLPWWNG